MGPKSGWGGGVVRLSETSPIPRSPDGDNNCLLYRSNEKKLQFYLQGEVFKIICIEYLTILSCAAFKGFCRKSVS